MFEEKVKLSQFSNYKIGGLARYFFVAKGLEELYRAVVAAKIYKWPVFILGGGTNLLISDKGFDGLVIKPDLKFINQTPCEGVHLAVTAGAGLLVSELLEFCIEKGLSGLEWAGGLPGTVGGAIRGNAGAFKGEIKDTIHEVVSFKYKDVGHPYIVKRDGVGCVFKYRDSIFKSGDGKDEIIITASFILKKGDKQSIRQAMEDKIKWRQERQPLDYPNIGSIFKNIAWSDVDRTSAIVGALKEELRKHMKTDPFPVLPAATLIDKANLKGISFGGAMISPKHPNFIVNLGIADAGDVKQLINLVKSVVRKKFAISLEEEIIYIN